MKMLAMLGSRLSHQIVRRCGSLREGEPAGTTVKTYAGAWRSITLAVASAWSLAACSIQNVPGLRLPSMGIKSYRAEEFFQGGKLEIAKALEAGVIQEA